MIAYDLTCDNAHRFEVWFRSSDDYTGQLERALLMCPHCGSETVRKAPMAPAVPTKGNSRSAGTPPQKLLEKSEGGKLPEKIKSAMIALAKAQAETIKDSTWVGKNFAQQSREMHYGEREDALIHGRASKEEVQGLVEEGVGIAPLLVPVVPPEEAN